VAKQVAEAVTATIAELDAVPIDELLERRYTKYRELGFFLE
jgi:acetyl-CoA carboxylase alpha subunit